LLKILLQKLIRHQGSSPLSEIPLSDVQNSLTFAFYPIKM